MGPLGPLRVVASRAVQLNHPATLRASQSCAAAKKEKKYA